MSFFPSSLSPTRLNSFIFHLDSRRVGPFQYNRFSYGPNIGEAVNFATHDWITHGSDANERYRSFARSAVFSHDRLTFTMAHHVSEQKSYRNCKLLLDELDRVVAEELLSRDRLIDSGVRDVSHLIQLPPNLLERLDETSADYDEKRLCHACKHVCFFSAVACECSQSKVSCLRHSHYMVRPMHVELNVKTRYSGAGFFFALVHF